MSFIIRTRGARGRMLAEYVCPEHGRFDALVQRDDAGDPPEVVTAHIDGCSARCELAISAVAGKVKSVYAVSQGGWAKPERKTYTDTRNLGEGQSLDDWKADRAKVWEEKRRQDVYDFAREHNERVIGGD